jgi:CRP-like cAMP-binding protein
MLRIYMKEHEPPMESSVPYPLSNILIDSLPEASRRSLLRYLEPVSLPVKTSLYESEDMPKYVHFLTSGIASIVTSMADGETTEVGTVGREGMPQGVHLLGPVAITTRCFMQIAGTGLRMDYKAFERIFNNEETVRRSTLAYAQYQTILLGQVAGCNRLHDVEPRLARWLLMVQDRTADSVLALTQEFLGQMIGSQRTTVSSVAGVLQQRGLIEYTRGKVRILNRAGLGNAACECYAATHKILATLYSMASQSLFDEALSK